MAPHFYRDMIRSWESKLEKDFINGKNKEDWLLRLLESFEPMFKKDLLTKVDDIILYTYHFLQSTSIQKKYRRRIIESGLVFHPDIYHIEQMKKLTIGQLTKIARKQCSKNELYSFFQGGFLGACHPIMMPSFIPLNIAYLLWNVQLTGLTFGYEMNSPYEMLLAIQLFYVATLPKKFQYEGWTKVKKSLEQTNILLSKKEIPEEKWLAFPVSEMMKGSMGQLFRNKKILKKFPLVSAGIHAFSQYSLTKQVSNFALKFYQYRYMKEKAVL
jgi:hypothetical protein